VRAQKEFNMFRASPIPLHDIMLQPLPGSVSASPSPCLGGEALRGLSAVCSAAGGMAALGVCLLWSYWPTLLRMVERWSHDPQYSHGFLVPVFAAAIVWHRHRLAPTHLMPNWWGLVWLGCGIAIRLPGAYGDIDSLDALSLLPTLAGLCLLVGGGAMLHWCWPAIAFLGFMMPLPFFAETALAHPLRRLGTEASTYLLQTCGYPAMAEGNIIFIDEVKLGVIDACSGLGMLMTFFALSTAMALVIERPLADKLVIFVSAIPIALIANITRITASGMVHWSWGDEAGNFLHDWAGWLMMPLALALLWLELRYLDRLLADGMLAGPLPIGLPEQTQKGDLPRQARAAQ